MDAFVSWIAFMECIDIFFTSRSGTMRKRSGFEGFPSDLRLNQTSSSRTSPSLRSREIVKGEISAISPSHSFADTFKSRAACLRTRLLTWWSRVSIVKVANSTQHFCVFGDHADHRLKNIVMSLVLTFLCAPPSWDFLLTL